MSASPELTYLLKMMNGSQIEDDRYAFKMLGSGSDPEYWCVGSGRDIVESRGVEKCARMPQWWSPSLRSVWRRNASECSIAFLAAGERWARLTEALTEYGEDSCTDKCFERVTASLDTGKEEVLPTISLEPAIKYLNATPVAPGRYAFQVLPAQGYHVTTVDDLLRLTPYVDEHPTEGWLSKVLAVQMPFWWRPDRQAAYRLIEHPYETSKQVSVFDSVATAKQSALADETYEMQYVTASLETGEESVVVTHTAVLLDKPKPRMSL